MGRPGQGWGQAQGPDGLGASVPLVEWHLAEVAAVVRGQPVPLDPALLSAVLRGLAELCRLLHERGREAGAVPPVLFRDNPVIAEALGMWATSLAVIASEQRRVAGGMVAAAVSGQPPRPAAAVYDLSTPNPARIYDYLLGGKDHFPVDRAAAEELLALVPEARAGARENRAFLGRAVRYLAGEAGIRQFLDIGTGMPTQGNVHEVAHAVDPDTRVVYVDNDPVVHAHANALLAEPTTAAVLADLRQPERITRHPKTRELLDFTQPMAVLLVAVLHFIEDEECPAGIVAHCREVIAPGSFLVISHATGDFRPDIAGKATEVYERASAPLVLRSRAQVAALLHGLELLPPGLVQPAAWRPDHGTGEGVGGFWAGVGRT
jgi:S-adenosyl methyltransferase